MLGRLAHLLDRALADLGQALGIDAAQHTGIGDRRFVVRMRCQQMRQQHDADQRMGATEARGALMVVEHAVGHERVEVPALDQPGAGFGVGDLQRALFDRTEAGIVRRQEAGCIFLGRGRQ